MKILFTFFVFFLFSAVSAQVPAQWRGPERDGVYPGTGLLSAWPADGPPLSWSVAGLGTGYSSAVSDGKSVYVTGMKDDQDVLTALTPEGKVKWQVPFGPSWNKSFPDTRCTPTVDGDRIYVVSGLGTIACISTADGKILWSFDGLTKFSGACGEWGVCESLLVTGGKVIYTPAGPKTTMVAIDKMTGSTAWESETLNDTSAYVSPRVIARGGKEIIVTIINKYLMGTELNTGKILWTFDYSALSPEKSLLVWPGAPKTNTITPLFSDGMLYITGGYNHVGAMFKLADDASSIAMVWSDTVLDCHHGGVVKHGDYIYGANWINNGMGNWCCIDWKSGKKMYEEKWYNKGAIIEAGGLLYCLDEKGGNLGLVRPTPEKFDLVSSFKITLGKGAFWSHPSVYDGMLYVRHGDVLMVYDIRQK
jgi:outer membrane protein assembly factor BamB